MSHRPLVLLSALAVAGAGLAAAPAGVQPVALLYPSNEGLQGFLLGGWSHSGGWQSPKHTAAGMSAAVTWRLQALSGPPRQLTAPTRVTFGEAPCEQTGLISLPGNHRLSGAQLATGAVSGLRPRPVTVLPTQSATYRALVRQELVNTGLKRPNVHLTTLVRADLDGNGTQEVLVAATHFSPDPEAGGGVPAHAHPGDYSVLLLRWTDHQRALTRVLARRTFPRAEKQGEWLLPERFEVLNVVDLNRDGRMEIVTTADYYEGSSAAVYEWTPALGLKERLNEGCGA